MVIAGCADAVEAAGLKRLSETAAFVTTGIATTSAMGLVVNPVPQLFDEYLLQNVGPLSNGFVQQDFIAFADLGALDELTIEICPAHFRLADAGDELLGNLVSLSADCRIKRLLNGLQQLALFISFA